MTSNPWVAGLLFAVLGYSVFDLMGSPADEERD